MRVSLRQSIGMAETMSVSRWQAVSILVHVKKACNSNRIFVGVGSPNPYGLRAGRPRPYDFDSRFALSFYMSLYFYTLTADDFSATRKMLILK